MTITNNDASQHIYRENGKIFLLDDLILKEIDDYFREYDDLMIIEYSKKL